jgi:5'-nucleotidase / UDP-sugar diphosphatase
MFLIIAALFSQGFAIFTQHIFDFMRYCSLIFLIFFSFAHAGDIKFTIVHTSDEHSSLLPAPLTDYHPEKDNPALGGYARLATKINQIRKEKGDEPVLVISSGDVMGGTPFAWLILNGYSAELEIMKHIGYDAMTIGNHEFDYGPETLAEYFLRAGYGEQGNKMSVISSNIVIPEHHSLGKVHIESNKIYQLSNGLKVGVFGLMGENALKLAPYAPPVTFSNPYESARLQVNQLKQQGADIIIAITHSGIREDRLLARRVAGIDIILGGHDHIKTEAPEVVNGVMIFHPSYYTQKAGVYEFAINSNQKPELLNLKNNKSILVDVDAAIEEDSTVAAMILGYKDALNRFVAEYTDSLFYDVQQTALKSLFSMKKEKNLKESSIGNFVTDAMRLVTQELTGEKVDFAFQANGVIRGSVIPGSMPWGENQVSFFDLVTVSGLGSGPDKLPGYPMVSVYLTEKEVLNALEVTAMLSQVYGDIFFLNFSGLRYTYDPGRALWMKVPFINLPLPANKAVISAEKFVGEGLQREGYFQPLDKNNDRLYHVVSDYYIISFLPMVGKILPHLEIVLKNKNGDSVEPDETIIYYNNREFKVWEAVARYANSIHQNGLLPEYYKNASARIIENRGVPLYVYAYSALALLFLLLAFGIYLLIKKIRTR